MDLVRGLGTIARIAISNLLFLEGKGREGKGWVGKGWEGKVREGKGWEGKGR